MTLQDFDHAERFVAGAVGPAGQRAFYLQASDGPRVVDRLFGYERCRSRTLS